MSTPHAATPDQWANIEKFVSGYGYNSCLLELRARVEALEREAAMNELRAASAEARPATFDEDENDRRFEQAKAIIDKLAPAPAGSLVEWVVPAIHHSVDLDLEARAAIRAVAAWMRDRGGYPWAWVSQILEKEADR